MEKLEGRMRPTAHLYRVDRYDHPFLEQYGTGDAARAVPDKAKASSTWTTRVKDWTGTPLGIFCAVFATIVASVASVCLAAYLGIALARMHARLAPRDAVPAPPAVLVHGEPVQISTVPATGNKTGNITRVWTADTIITRDDVPAVLVHGEPTPIVTVPVAGNQTGNRTGVQPPAVLVHGEPVQISTVPAAGNNTGNRTRIWTADTIITRDDDATEAEQSDDEADIIDLETGDDVDETADAAVGPASTTMASLTIVKVFPAQTKTAIIAYWPDVQEPTAKPAATTVKVRPPSGEMLPWWHRPQVETPRGASKAMGNQTVTNATAQQIAAANNTRKFGIMQTSLSSLAAYTATASRTPLRDILGLPVTYSVAAAATSTRKFGAMQTSLSPFAAATATASHAPLRDTWGLPVAHSVTGFTQQAKQPPAAAQTHHQTTTVFYSVGQLATGAPRPPTVVPAAKNASIGGTAGHRNNNTASAARPVPLAGAIPAPLNKTAAFVDKGGNKDAWNRTTSLLDTLAHAPKNKTVVVAGVVPPKIKGAGNSTIPARI